MMRKGRNLIKSYMTLEYDFTGIRIQDSHLTPVDWKLTVNLVATNKKNKTKEENEFNANISYQKIYFWLETNMQNIAVVDVNKEDDLYIANLSSNVTMYCPANPGDDVIIQLLHAKISSLANANLVVGEIHLKGSDTSLQYTYDCPDEGYHLPGSTSGSYKDGKVRDDIPWWFRDDGFCFEFIGPDSDDEDSDLFKDIIDPMDEFRRIISEIDAQVGIVKEPARILQLEKWKPRTI